MRDDADAGVDADQKSLGNLKRALTGVPSLAAPGEEPPFSLEDLVSTLSAGIAEGVQARWRDLRAFELLLAEVQAEFAGEDPVKSDRRDLLRQAYGELESACAQLRPFGHGIELPEATEEDVEVVRMLLQKGERLFS